jgi:2-aminoadipate transaminase
MGSRIDPYAGQYASRARGMVASEIRALFAVASRPEIVSLAGGSPFVSALPLEAVGDMVGQLIASRGQDVLQYCTAQGDVKLREQMAMRAAGLDLGACCVTLLELAAGRQLT